MQQLSIGKTDYWGNKETVVDLNSNWCIWSIVVLAVIGPSVFILQPGYVQGLVNYMGYSEEQAGLVASAEMFGLAAMAILINFFSQSVNWRVLSAGFLTISAVGNILSIGVSGVDSLMMLRFFTGLGSGGLISITFVMMGLTSRAERNMGFIVSTLLVYGAIGLLVMPAAFRQVGMDGVLVFFSLFSVFGFWFVRHLPCSNQLPKQIIETTPPVSRLTKASALTGMLLYNIAIGIVWVYMFLVGVDAGISEQAVANVLTVSQFVGIAGAFAAVLTELKFGRSIPLAFGILGGAVGIALLLDGPTFYFYLMGVCTFNFLWNLTTPYFAATLASYDSSGRILSFGVAMQMLGFALGPAIAAMLVNSGGYDLINSIAIGLFAATAIVVIPGTLKQRRQQNSP